MKRGQVVIAEIHKSKEKSLLKSKYRSTIIKQNARGSQSQKI
jgi:hypothetical protein